jgi:hypothetical protein
MNSSKEHAAKSELNCLTICLFDFFLYKNTNQAQAAITSQKHQYNLNINEKAAVAKK